MSNTSAMSSWSGEHNFVSFRFPLVLGADDYHEFSYLAHLLGYLAKAKVQYTEIENHGNHLQGDYPNSCTPYTAVFYVNYTPEVVECINKMKSLAEEEEAS